VSPATAADSHKAYGAGAYGRKYGNDTSYDCVDVNGNPYTNTYDDGNSCTLAAAADFPNSNPGNPGGVSITW
jgi:hypothetical protein